MSAPANFDVSTLTHEEYLVLRVWASVEGIYDAVPKPPPPGRITLRELVDRYEAMRLRRRA
ncbi:MAG: hypothetical protein AB1942_20035 [Pseudomonadota bacterium]